ncbi:MAG TPA: hypothetical protein VMB18_03740 [Terriglobales bacterium]|nr:hypothetical protein [Terriglobales bacterium]
MMDEKALTEARQKAERAVADMPEGDLKLKAFELILTRLLYSSGDTAISDDGGVQRSKGHPRTRTRAGSPPSDVLAVDTPPISTPTRILQLKKEGFFSEERSISEIQDELRTRGWRYETTALSGPLIGLVQARELRRAKGQDGNKTIYKYFNP